MLTTDDILWLLVAWLVVLIVVVGVVRLLFFMTGVKDSAKLESEVHRRTPR